MSLTGWGTEAAPLLPATVRQALDSDRIDEWIAPELGVGRDATFAALDRDAWVGGARWSVRVENYLVAVFRKSLPRFEKNAALAAPIPPHVDLAAIPWRNRTRNALARDGLLHDRNRLSEITYADLLSLPGMGYASALDFAATTESYVEELPATAVAEVRTMTDEVLQQWWADQVTGDDPRFADLLPHRHTVAQQLELLLMTGQESTRAAADDARALLPELERRVNEFVHQTLEENLSAYISAALPALDQAHSDALLARMGWKGEPPITLEAAGHLMGTTRERVRQIQARLHKRRPTLPVFMPALDQALDELAAAAPISSQAAGRLLQTKGITHRPFHPASVLSAAEYCGKSAAFELHQLGGGEMLVSVGDLAGARGLEHVAYRQAGRYGASNLEEVLAEGAAKGLHASVDELRTYLNASPRLQFLDHEWFWSPAIANERNRLHNTTRGILSVVSPMEVMSLREGIRRRYHWRGLELVPPRAILLKFFEAHPDFVVEGQCVRPTAPLDYRRELGASEQVLVEVLRATPTHILDRTSLMQACIARGINENTISVMLSYSSVLAHLETDAWALRGSDVTPAALQAVMEANARRPRQRRVVAYGWTPDGQLWLAYRIPSPHSLVIGIPTPIARYVAGSQFNALAEDGTATGTVVVDADSTSSWGYGPFLRRRGADDGDVIRVTFDLMEKTARLALEDSDALDDDPLGEAFA